MALYLDRVDLMDGGGQPSQSEVCGTWDGVVAMVRQLDGVTVSAVNISRGFIDNDWVMPYVGLAGGDDGRVWAWLTLAAGRHWSLEAGDDRPDPIWLNVAGQPVDIASRRAVQLDLAIDAIRSFVEAGKVDERFVWVDDGPRDISVH